jgi:hypothetical protein
MRKKLDWYKKGLLNSSSKKQWKEPPAIREAFSYELVNISAPFYHLFKISILLMGHG